MTTKPPENLQPSTWRVTKEDGSVDVMAVWANLSGAGAVAFRDGIGNLVEAFAGSEWLHIKKLD